MGEQIRAAGAVLWRRDGDELHVGLVHRPRYDDWSHPKGKSDAGETPEETAVREVAEETGYHGRLGADLGEVRYEVRGRTKVVRYWALEATGGGFRPNDEVDELAWLSPTAAMDRLDHDLDREVLARFVDTT